MIDNFLIGMGICLIVHLISQPISSWFWSKYAKQSLYEDTNRNKRLKTFYYNLYKFFETFTFVSQMTFAIFLLFSIFKLVGV